MLWFLKGRKRMGLADIGNHLVETVLVVSEDVLKRVLLPTDWWTPEVMGR
jgi:hypothetical protein